MMSCDICKLRLPVQSRDLIFMGRCFEGQLEVIKGHQLSAWEPSQDEWLSAELG